MGKFNFARCGPILFALTVIAWGPPAVGGEGVCIDQHEPGMWVNVNPDWSDILRLDISQIFGCSQNRRPARDLDPDWPGYYGPSWYVEPFGKCSGEECSWGRSGGTQLDQHRYGYFDTYLGRVALFPIFAAFDRGNSQIYLYIHASLEERGTLSVRVYTDYPNGGRSDTAEHLTFRRLDGNDRPMSVATLKPFWMPH